MIPSTKASLAMLVHLPKVPQFSNLKIQSVITTKRTAIPRNQHKLTRSFHQPIMPSLGPSHYAGKTSKTRRRRSERLNASFIRSPMELGWMSSKRRLVRNASVSENELSGPDQNLTNKVRSILRTRNELTNRLHSNIEYLIAQQEGFTDPNRSKLVREIPLSVNYGA